MSFHIDPQGNPGECSAVQGRCPYGDSDRHYTTLEDAREAYEVEMEPEMLPPIRKLGALTRRQAIELDQFFTKDQVAQTCAEILRGKLSSLGYDATAVHFVEPSAGGGAFVRAVETAFPGAPIKCGDLAPKDENTVQLDFINDAYDELLAGDAANRIVIGNPPFGKRSRLAKDFINRAFEFSDTVAFVIPVQFQKYGTQKDIVADAKLVHDERLDADAFTVNGTSYAVQCCLQVWTRRDTDLPDLRKRIAPPIVHEDFDTWIVGSKPESKRHIEEADWDYAVVTQGFAGQFELIPRSEKDSLSPKRQYMLMKCNTDSARARFEAMDWEALASLNTTRVKGFGKADLVEAYSVAE